MIEGTLILFTKDTKLRGVDDRPGEWADTQGNLNRLEKRAVRDTTTFSKWKKHFLLLSRNGPFACQWPAGWKAAWQGRIWRSWWMPSWLWAKNMFVWQRWPVGSWAALASRPREVTLSLYSTQGTHIWSDGLLSARYWFSGASLVVGSTCQEKHTHWRESSTGNYWRLHHWSICQCGERLRGLELFSLEKRRVSGGIINVHKSLARRQSQPIFMALHERPRSNRHKLKHRKFHLDA